MENSIINYLFSFTRLVHTLPEIYIYLLILLLNVMRLQDVTTYVRAYGRLDLFITFTSDPY